MTSRSKVSSIFLSLAAICSLVGCSQTQTKTAVATATPPTPAATAAYKAAYHMWCAGSQAEAEQMLAKDVLLYPRNQRLAFFQAACVRSRFNVGFEYEPREIDKAGPYLEKVVELDPQSSMGQCANDIWRIDRSLNFEDSPERDEGIKNITALSNSKAARSACFVALRNRIRQHI